MMRLDERQKNNLENNREQLLNQFELWGKADICIAFSGGVDSGLLLKLATDATKYSGQKVYAVTFDTVLHPRADVEVAKAVVKEMGAIHEIIKVDELTNEKIKNNDRDRCYYCKRELFEQLINFANTKGVGVIVEGTNHDDLAKYRPGIRAVRELGVASPLAEYGLSKEEIRIWAKELGISVSKRPSAPCLATRLPYDTVVDLKVLERIEKSEEYLRKMGFENVRVRVYPEKVRVEVDKEMISKALEQEENIANGLKRWGFTKMIIDPKGFRSGSMDAEE